MGNPPDASLDGDGFRFYEWKDAASGVTTNVLAVSSVRALAGEPFNLVRWKVANVVDVAMSTRKVTVIGPRGGVSDKRLKEEFPGEFLRMMLESEGQQTKLDEIRRWVNAAADDGRNVAARRGSMTHDAIEGGVKSTHVTRAWVETAFARLSERDRKAAKRGVLDEDVEFIRKAVTNYEAMRVAVPFVIIAREVQCWNLSVGYAGTLDALVWLPPEGWSDPLPRPETITAEWVDTNGGRVAVYDWKTSKDIHTDNVTQVTAYLSAEFVGSKGIRDERLTGLLTMARWGAVAHVRPNKFGLYIFTWSAEIARAFFGSVAFSRFLAKYPKPEELFIETYTGDANENHEDDDD